MTNILLITNKTDITTDFIVKSLKKKEILFYRLNTEDIGNTIQLCFDFDKNQFLLIDLAQNITLNLLKIKSVYFRRPEINDRYEDLSLGERNFIRSELLFTLEGLYKILHKAFWVNTVPAIRNAENKIYQLLLAKELGFLMPDSLITNIPSVAQVFVSHHNNSCIIKPVKSGLVEGKVEEGVIFTSRINADESDFERIRSCPVYLQNLIPKEGDVRVTVVGQKVFPALIHSQESGSHNAEIDWRKSETPLKHTAIELPESIIQKCLMLTKILSLNFAAIDFVLDKKGNFIFLEINANGQWAWIEKRLNFNISDEITNLMVENHTD